VEETKSSLSHQPNRPLCQLLMNLEATTIIFIQLAVFWCLACSRIIAISLGIYGIMRLARAIDLTLPLFASSIAVALPTDTTGNVDPAVSEITISGCNSTTEPAFDLNTLEHSNQLSNQRIVARQSGCPTPSTDSFCQTGYCFLSSSYEGSTWGTCCPAGWSLWLDQAIWEKQKCCPPGTSGSSCDGSEAPLEPSDCGSGGVISGWACVYSDQTSDSRRVVAACSTLMAPALVVSWIGIVMLG